MISITCLSNVVTTLCLRVSYFLLVENFISNAICVNWTFIYSFENIHFIKDVEVKPSLNDEKTDPRDRLGNRTIDKCTRKNPYLRLLAQCTSIQCMCVIRLDNWEHCFNYVITNIKYRFLPGLQTL